MITPEQLAKSGTEAGAQKALFCWCALNIASYPQLKFLAHVPNGGFRNVSEAANLKAQGVRRGFPDLILPWPSRHFHGLFIEMKAANGVVSNEQIEWLDYLSSVGYLTSVQYSWEGARDLIVDYITRT